MKKYLALLFAASLVALGACGGGDDDDAADGGVGTISIGHLVNAGQTPIFVAEQNKMFEGYGLTVERTEFPDFTAMVAALEHGDIQMISSIPGPMQAAIEGGFQLRTFMQQETAHQQGQDSGALIARKDGDVKTLKDLEGKKVGGITGTKYVLTADMYEVLDKAGVDTTKVEFVTVPFPNHYDVLNSKQVDAVLTIDPFTTQIMSAGIGNVLSYFYVDSNPGQPLSSWWAKADWLEEHDDQIAAFQDAVKDAIDWLREDDDRARDTVAEFTGLDPEVLKDMLINEWAYEVDEATWERQTEILVKWDALSKMQSLDEVWAPQMRRFVE